MIACSRPSMAWGIGLRPSLWHYGVILRCNALWRYMALCDSLGHYGFY